VHSCDTTAAQWQHAQTVGDVDQAVLKDVVIDDCFFGVSAESADGYESPVVFPGDPGILPAHRHRQAARAASADILKAKRVAPRMSAD